MGHTISCFDVVQRDAPTQREFAGRGAAVVTGSTSGLGIPTTESMLMAGFDRVFATARNDAAADSLVAGVKAKLGDEVAARLTIVKLDMANLSSVQRAARLIDEASGADGVSVLVNNAGINTGDNSPTADGLELQIGTNHFGPTLFTDELRAALRRSGRKSGADDPARVIFVASNGHRFAPSGDGFNEAAFRHNPNNSVGMWTRYGQSKLANILAALALDAEFKAAQDPIVAFSLHPGVVSTNIVRDYPLASVVKFFGDIFVKSPPQGAATQVYCALSRDALRDRGGYFDNCAASTASAQGRNLAAAQSLMTITRRIAAERLADAGTEDARE
jgi:NAD(P)-dependent dehydrogenase (short-subunit alcohol dehydrogenase family)